MYLIGYDIGSSSIKAALVEVSTGLVHGLAQYPEREMTIHSRHAGWAEQDPGVWWDAVCNATQQLLIKSRVDAGDIRAIGISYQMHGLVLVDGDHKVLRPSIIWCDGRAVKIGDEAFSALGKDHCLSKYLNSPGNFTASKLKWVKDHEPDVYKKVHKMMLPGDYIAMKMTGEIRTTISGLSEGILWDFDDHIIADQVLEYMDLDKGLIPELVNTFSPQGELTRCAAEELGLKQGIPLAYRAGDQPNNAFSLGVTSRGEVAATGGTSGVIYAVTDQVTYDPESRVNVFAHVNHRQNDPHLGILLCINGAGILYSWMKKNIIPGGLDYDDMEMAAALTPIGADGLTIVPFGNGPERVINNKNPGCHISNLQLNKHNRGHILRASLEGIACAYVYGFKIMEEMGVDTEVIRVGNDNLFQSMIFTNTVATLLGKTIEIRKTTGAIGAARGAGCGVGLYKDIDEAITEEETRLKTDPHPQTDEYREVYMRWENQLNHILKNH